jgi:hypothetical protein
MKLPFYIVTSLLAALAVMLVVSCGCNAAPSNASENGKTTSKGQSQTAGPQVFKSVIDKLSASDIASVAIIRIDDMVKKDPNRERQVTQQILQELTNVDGLQVVEGDQQEIQKYFAEKGVDPARGLSTDASINLCVLLNVDAVIYGTIESEDCDVNLKVYQAKDGGVLLSETIGGLKLPLDKEKKKFVLPPGVLEPGSTTGSE